MKPGKYITMDGASLLVGHVLSFDSEKEFIERYESELFQNLDAKARRAKLRLIYKLAKQAEQPE